MNSLNEKIVAAWLEAATDLGIEVVAPYRIIADEPKILVCEAFIPDFGSANGAIAISSRSRSAVRPMLRDAKRWHSELGDGYARYKRKVFADTLNDWGWFGQEHLKPDWYNGNYWS